jgi:hypothetical protein
MHSAIVHRDFHRLCDPLNAFQYLINEAFFIRFLALRERDKPSQSVASADIVIIAFFGPIVGDTLGTTSSRARKYCR